MLLEGKRKRGGIPDDVIETTSTIGVQGGNWENILHLQEVLVLVSFRDEIRRRQRVR